MPILTVSALAKTYGGDLLLDGVAFSIEPKEKAALVGRNGTGKTTLLRIAAGLLEADRGTVRLASWARAAYLAQLLEGPADVTVWTHVLAGAADLRTLEGRLRTLEAQMSTPEVHGDPARLQTVMDEYGSAQAHFDHVGGFTVEARAGMVLSGLGFSATDREKLLGTLSGGWRVRAELARVLLAEPDLLLLDEPTNHLDLDALQWLEEYLQGFPGAAIVVSHDRSLINAVTTRTLELEDRRITSYPGAYTTYLRLKTEQHQRQRDLFQRQQEEMARLEDYIRRYRAGNRAAMAKSREKRLGRVQERLVAASRAHRAMAPRPSAGSASGRTVATLQGVGKRYGDRLILRDLDLVIFRGDRIGLLGPNGAGKTTVLRLLAALEPPSTGRVTLGANVRAAYFAQEPTSLSPEHSVLDEVLADRLMTPEAVRTFLDRFLFRGDDVFKRVSMLSGGERQRLSLAKMLLDEPNLLLLDEPTNHLDIPSREALEAALREFAGTIVVATHDRYLLERIATRIFMIQDGVVSDFHGTYEELRRRRRRRERARPQGTVGNLKGATPGRGRATPPAVRTFDEVAAEIAAAERELEDAGRALGDPELYRDAPQVRGARARYDAAQRRLDELYRILATVRDESPSR